MVSVDFSKYRSDLNAIFFPREGSFVVKRSSPEYDEFWSFLVRYQILSSKKAQTSENRRVEPSVSSQFGLPRHYDKRHRLNLDLKSYRLEDHVRHHLDDHSRRSHLSEDALHFFKFVLCMFVDFLQKRKFHKLGKIRSDKQNLPIYGFREQILSSVAANQIVLIAGDTGCGKSTQVPQYLYEADYPKIAVTQPRRIACMSLASRVGYETLSQFSGKVGYQVRFEKAVGRNTAIVFLTEGLLLRQMMDDPLLERYAVLVLDEVHERHIFTDFLLGVVKCLVRARPDVKVILMSATINLTQFSSYFDNCPVVKVPGRLFPIELEYHPIKVLDPNSKSDRLDPEPYLRIMQTIDTRYPEHERGDLLIFVSGMTDIQSISEAAKVYAERSRKWIVLALHSALSVREQDKVFDVAPFGVRKCIVSTNIAETSITIDGVRFVVDSGRVKEMSWEASAKMQRLQQFWISRASAEQRKGRSGRTGPGVCFRLYSQEDYDSLQEYSTPEIRRLPLDSLVLQMVSLGLPDVRRFPFLEPPDATSLELSVRRLADLGALTEQEELTPLGRLLSQLPVEVVLGKMLLFGALFHMTEAALTLAAALSVQSPLTARAFTDPELSRARRPYESEEGSPLALVNLFNAWLEAKKEEGGGGGSRRWCRRMGLEEQRMYEMTKLRSQFRSLLQEHQLMKKSLEEEEGGRGRTALDSRAYRLDRKRLQRLRREKRSLTNRKRRKVLDFDTELRTGDTSPPRDEEDMDGVLCDLEDLEFRLLHNADDRDRRSLSRREVEMLKIVICSGLYPQFAIADDNNSFRKDSEQSFHTKAKNFVLLHPNDFFASNPQLLRPKEDSTVTANDGMSSEHSLLAFVSLLETTKPFLMSTIRVPAMQALLLFSQSIDANVNGSRLVFDEWLEVRFGNAEDAEHMISSALQLRTTLERLLALKIRENSDKERDDGQADSAGSSRGDEATLERILAFKLTDFLCSDVRYSLRRLLAADLKTLYRDKHEGQLEGKQHPSKGGQKLTPFLTFDCLTEETQAEAEYRLSSQLRTTWTCLRCSRTLAVTAAERLSHEGSCQGDADRVMRTEAAHTSSAHSKRFRCDLCGGDFDFSSAEAIRHRRQCDGK